MSTPRTPVTPSVTPRVIEEKKDWKTWAKDWLKQNGFKGSEAELEIASTDFEKTYRTMMGGVKDPERTSTQPQSLATAAETQQVLIDGERARVDTSVDLAGRLLPIRGQMQEQNSDAYAANLGAHTAAVSQILGDPQSKVIADQGQNRLELARLNNEYLTGRNNTLVGAMERMHTKENDPNALDYMNFVKDLGITAAMIFD